MRAYTFGQLLRREAAQAVASTPELKSAPFLEILGLEVERVVVGQRCGEGGGREDRCFVDERLDYVVCVLDGGS